MKNLNHPLGRLANRPSDYVRLKLDPSVAAPWEDAIRTVDVDVPGAYEWWWVDFTTDDGTSVVIIYETKPYSDPRATLSPVVTITVTYPDGKIVDKEFHGTPDDFYASKDKCDVRIGKSSLRGDLKTYHVDATVEDVEVKAEVTGIVRSWRPYSGMMEFGPLDKPSGFLGWFPSIPAGKATGTFTVDGKTTHFKECSAYHDHNWGDVPIPDVIHHWYWARGTCGPYTVVAGYIVSSEKYGLAPIKQILIAKNGQILADNPDRLELRTEGVFTDEKSGRPTPNKLIFSYTQDNESIQIIFDRKSTIRWEQPSADGWYLRFTGDVTIRSLIDDEVTESVTGPGIWEMMYPGRAIVSQL